MRTLLVAGATARSGALGSRAAWRLPGVAVLLVTGAVIADRAMRGPVCAYLGAWGWMALSTALLGCVAQACRATLRRPGARPTARTPWGWALLLALALGAVQVAAAWTHPHHQLPRSPWLLLYLTVLVPVAEELAFRGVVHDALRAQLPATAATLLSAALFAAAHPAGPPALFAFGLGLVLAIAYERAGTLAVPMAGHAAFNLAAYGLAVLTR